MIKNTNEILAENLAKVKGILREFVKSVLDDVAGNEIRTCFLRQRYH